MFYTRSELAVAAMALGMIAPRVEIKKPQDRKPVFSGPYNKPQKAKKLPSNFSSLSPKAKRACLNKATQHG